MNVKDIMAMSLLLGLYHWFGEKLIQSFKGKLKQEPMVDHSYAGARYLFNLMKPIIMNCRISPMSSQPITVYLMSTTQRVPYEISFGERLFSKMVIAFSSEQASQTRRILIEYGYDDFGWLLEKAWQWLRKAVTARCCESKRLIIRLNLTDYTCPTWKQRGCPELSTPCENSWTTYRWTGHICIRLRRMRLSN